MNGPLSFAFKSRGFSCFRHACLSSSAFLCCHEALEGDGDLVPGREAKSELGKEG